MEFLRHLNGTRPSLTRKYDLVGLIYGVCKNKDKFKFNLHYTCTSTDKNGLTTNLSRESKTTL